MTKKTYIIKMNSRTGKDINVATNAERIRSMSDEELAAYIFELGNYTEYCYGHCAYQDDEELCKVHSSRGLKQEGCIRGVIEWLQSPAETEGTE